MRKYILEAVGTFFLVLVFGFTGNAIAIGLVLSALVYVGAHISGSQYNPAVSMALFFSGKLSLGDFFIYIFCQLAGAFIAAIVIYFFSGSVFYVEPPYDTNIYQQAGAEVLLTFIFVWVVLVFMHSKALKNNKIYGFAIGLTFSGIIITGSKISGGIYNPAISIGPTLFDLIMGGNSYNHLLLYTFSPIAGGTLAAAAFTYFEK